MRKPRSIHLKICIFLDSAFISSNEEFQENSRGLNSISGNMNSIYLSQPQTQHVQLLLLYINISIWMSTSEITFVSQIRVYYFINMMHANVSLHV